MTGLVIFLLGALLLLGAGFILLFVCFRALGEVVEEIVGARRAEKALRVSGGDQVAELEAALAAAGFVITTIGEALDEAVEDNAVLTEALVRSWRAPLQVVR